MHELTQELEDQNDNLVVLVKSVESLLNDLEVVRIEPVQEQFEVVRSGDPHDDASEDHEQLHQTGPRLGVLLQFRILLHCQRLHQLIQSRYVVVKVFFEGVWEPDRGYWSVKLLQLASLISAFEDIELHGVIVDQVLDDLEFHEHLWGEVICHVDVEHFQTVGGQLLVHLLGLSVLRGFSVVLKQIVDYLLSKYI